MKALTILLLLAACLGKDAADLITARARETRGMPLDLRDLNVGPSWDQICVFGPYTTDAGAALLVGNPEFRLSEHSDIGSHDSFSAVAFVKKLTVVEVAEIKRGDFDFAKYSGKCFNQPEAVFE